MSIRTLLEINHDFHPDEGLIPALQRYLASASNETAYELERYGIRIISNRHHSGQFWVEREPDGFPLRIREPQAPPLTPGGRGMNEVVERVARALGEELVRQELSGDFDEDASNEMLARAAIEAMAEPTDAMIEAGLAQKALCEDGTGRAACVIEHAWPVMIEAALR